MLQTIFFKYDEERESDAEKSFENSIFFEKELDFF